MLTLEHLIETVAHRHEEHGRRASAAILRRYIAQMSLARADTPNAYAIISSAINHRNEQAADRACGDIESILLTLGAKWSPTDARELIEGMALSLSERGF